MKTFRILHCDHFISLADAFQEEKQHYIKSSGTVNKGI